MELMMRKLNLLLMCLGLCLVVGMFAGQAAAGQTACDESHCTYLPFVFRPEPPVRIAYITTEGQRDLSQNLFGELINVTSSPVYSVTHETNFYSPDGQIVRRSEGTVYFSAVLPGQPVPFEAGNYDPYDENLTYRVFITGYSTSSQSEYQPVTILSKQLSGHRGTATFSGEIRNDSSQSLQSIKVVLWSRENRIGPRPAIVADPTLAPGETTSYSVFVDVSEYSPDPSEYSVEGQGEVVP
jgi:hypothetical protein